MFRKFASGLIKQVQDCWRNWEWAHIKKRSREICIYFHRYCSRISFLGKPSLQFTQTQVWHSYIHFVFMGHDTNIQAASLLILQIKSINIKKTKVMIMIMTKTIFY